MAKDGIFRLESYCMSLKYKKDGFGFVYDIYHITYIDITVYIYIYVDIYTMPDAQCMKCVIPTCGSCWGKWSIWPCNHDQFDFAFIIYIHLPKLVDRSFVLHSC